MWTNESFSFAFQLEVSSQKLRGACYPEDFVLFSSMKLFLLMKNAVWGMVELHEISRREILKAEMKALNMHFDSIKSVKPFAHNTILPSSFFSQFWIARQPRKHSQELSTKSESFTNLF